MPDNNSVEPNGNWRERADSLERRLDRLTERHEALTQSIELMRLDAEQRQQDWLKRSEKTDERFLRLLTAVESLAEVARDHTKRIEDLEGNQ